MWREQREYNRAVQLKERAEAEAARLQEEAAAARRVRGELLRAHRAESAKAAKVSGSFRWSGS